MKFSEKVKKCGLSPMRKFHPYAVAAKAAGKKIYHLNIGQPDLETPAAAFEAVQAYDRAHPSSTASPDFADRRAVVGMLGFPNVGKSSLINVLLGVSATSHGAVRVAVGATPGKTKHLQTVVLSDSLLLCDCPGLVFPVFMNTKADLLFNGVLPASNMRDYISIGLLS